MCNIILVKFNNNIDNDNKLNIVTKLAHYLKIRGRDNYTFYNITSDILYSSNVFVNFLDALKSSNNYNYLLMHSRAIPETENIVQKPNIYTNDRFIVAHHGIIPNAEKINNLISIDSEALLDIYIEITSNNNIEKAIYESFKKYPRATTEIVYDKLLKKTYIATTFMPLYIYNDNEKLIYSTYNVFENSYTIKPYNVIIL